MYGLLGLGSPLFSGCFCGCVFSFGPKVILDSFSLSTLGGDSMIAKKNYTNGLVTVGIKGLWWII